MNSMTARERLNIEDKDPAETQERRAALQSNLADSTRDSSVPVMAAIGVVRIVPKRICTFASKALASYLVARGIDRQALRGKASFKGVAFLIASPRHPLR